MLTAVLVLTIINTAGIAWGCFALHQRTALFRKFFDLLDLITVQQEEVQAIREDWERRGHGRLEDS